MNRLQFFNLDVEAADPFKAEVLAGNADLTFKLLLCDESNANVQLDCCASSEESL